MKKLLTLLLVLLFPGICLSTPTRLVVRVRANDAKFVGTAVGGVKVIIRDYFTGKILATGMIEGGTGNTKVLMKEPIVRGKILSVGKNTAKFECVFDIKEPVKIQIDAIGPLSAGIDMHKETKTVWLIPGKDIKGDGIMFVFYGLIVHPYSPKPHQFYFPRKKVIIGAHVAPMCGCPVKPKCLWDAKNFKVVAHVIYNKKEIAKIPLMWKSVSDFEAEFIPKACGGYKVIITAYDNANNTGVGITGFVVIPKKKYDILMKWR